MKYRIRFLPEAKVDRAEIKEYLDKFYAGSAERFFSILKSKISHLGNFPYICSVYDDDPDYRKLIVGEYLVFYMVNEDEKFVEIHRIFHGSQDIKRRL